jgi:hypothetical protein
LPISTIPLFPSSSTSLPPSLPTFHPDIMLKNYPGQKLNLDGTKFLLCYPTATLNVDELLRYLQSKWIGYDPKMWSRVLPSDAKYPTGWTAILILFGTRFRTQKSNYFTFSGVCSFIYQIIPTSMAAWDIAYQFVVNWGNNFGKITFPEVNQLTAYQNATLNHPWQKAVCHWLSRGPEKSTAGVPLFNFFHNSLHYSINEFCQWIQYQHPRDVIAFPAGLKTPSVLKKDLRNFFVEGKTGKILIITVFETTFHANPRWSRSADLIQMVRYSSLMQGWTPEVILIFSKSAITYDGMMSPIGTHTLNLNKTPDLISEEGQFNDDYTAAVQLLDQASPIERSLGKHEQKAHKTLAREGSRINYHPPKNGRFFV